MAATHLGNVRDLPARSLDALRGADLLIFEEDRPARSFLKAAGVTREYLKYSEHVQKETLADCSEALRRGQWVCYMSDQGTPGLSDPGRALVELAFNLGAKVDVVPGPSALTAAIAACPFDCWAFHFLGFLPREPDRRKVALVEAGELSRPLVLMDTPYRLKHILAACADVYGTSRRGFIALDISGEQEAFWLGKFKDLATRAEALEGDLNFVLIIEDKPAPPGPARSARRPSAPPRPGAKRPRRKA